MIGDRSADRGCAVAAERDGDLLRQLGFRPGASPSAARGARDTGEAQGLEGLRGGGTSPLRRGREGRRIGFKAEAEVAFQPLALPPPAIAVGKGKAAAR
uniref:Uncharacterized protein n=1 Tax=Arundo donax TaxID=35708 RepID=A0A0A9HLV5_ARUDO